MGSNPILDSQCFFSSQIGKEYINQPFFIIIGLTIIWWGSGLGGRESLPLLLLFFLFYNSMHLMRKNLFKALPLRYFSSPNNDIDFIYLKKKTIRLILY